MVSKGTVIVVCSQRAAMGVLTGANEMMGQGPHLVMLNVEDGSIFRACNSHSTSSVLMSLHLQSMAFVFRNNGSLLEPKLEN